MKKKFLTSCFCCVVTLLLVELVLLVPLVLLVKLVLLVSLVEVVSLVQLVPLTHISIILILVAADYSRLSGPSLTELTAGRRGWVLMTS